MEKIDNSIKRIDSKIKKATKENNKTEVEKLTQQKEGLLKNRKEIENKKYTVEDFKRVGDESYLMRAFDKNKIVANIQGFKDAVKAGMISKLRQKGLFEKENLTASEKAILKKLNKQVLMIPIATGLFSKYGLVINPMIASIMMTLSSLCVVINSLRLRRIFR